MKKIVHLIEVTGGSYKISCESEYGLIKEPVIVKYSHDVEKITCPRCIDLLHSINEYGLPSTNWQVYHRGLPTNDYNEWKY